MQYLIIYWFLFWQKFLRNPYLLCTSEVASTNFPHWIWMGRKWRMRDDLYYKYPASIPFLSMWYFPSVLVSKFSKHLSLDGAFKLYTYFILSHYLLGSILSYLMFRQWTGEIGAIFGALTLTYAGYCIKPQTPSFVYTICWVPGFFINSPLQPLFLTMAILGGYWPILVYMAPLCLIFSPLNCVLGLLTAFPQVIPFIKYWKRSVRSGQKVDKKTGSIPWRKLKDLFWPTNSVGLTRGVHYPEVAMYMGIAPFFTYGNLTIWHLLLGLGLLLTVGIIPPIQRIPARALYLITFSICFLIKEVPIYLLVFQSFLLLQNSSIYPSFPFSQWWGRPSKVYPKADYTGYLTNKKTNDYLGGFSLKEAHGCYV